MADSTIRLPADSTGSRLLTHNKGTGAAGSGTDKHAQFVIPTDTRNVSFVGRASTFRTPGRAGTAGQKIFALHNATGSTVLVDVNHITLDLAVTAAKAVTVLPPLIEIARFTTLPTGGTAGTKVAFDTTQTSSASLTVWQDASADGTSSATALTITPTAGATMASAFAPRLITAAGYEPFDRETFFDSDYSSVTLRPLEGLVLFLDYVLATQNPITDMWSVTAEWVEYTVSSQA